MRLVNIERKTIMKKIENGSYQTPSSFSYHSQSISDVADELHSDCEKGLSVDEAEKRLGQYGPNRIQEGKKTSFLVKFLKQFIEPMVIVLLCAALVSFAIFIINGCINVSDGASFLMSKTGTRNDEYIDGIVIIAIIIINAFIGAIQEQKAEQSLEALKKLSTPMCKVKRDGKIHNIKSEDVVYGDLVILEEGDIIPADLRLVYSVDMKSDESSLTGESIPVEKNAMDILPENALTAEKTNIVYSGCPVSYGRGAGLVIHTGMDTEVGKIASMLKEKDDDETPLQKKLARLSKQLGLICLVIVIVTFLAGLVWTLVRGASTGWTDLPREILSMFEEAIALAVAAIPEGLSAIVTIALALGVNKLVKVNTIVRKLPSVETLGSVTTVCSDKTGTLTQNRMTVKKVYIDGIVTDADRMEKDKVSFLATGMMLCSNASIENDRYGDPTEIALLDYARTFSIEKEETERNLQPRVDELPFDSNRKMMSVENKTDRGNIIYTKGALDSILKHTRFILDDGKVREITSDDIEKINSASKTMADEAYRVLAFAYKMKEDEERMTEENLVYVGMVGMIDPERKEAAPAVLKLKNAGIRTVMITGDHKDTAFAIAKNLHIADDISQCCSGDELDRLDGNELSEKVKTTNVFARVSPENKVQIVKALKRNGEIVSMTGDGVNDAPSLKSADIGIAMGITGTDVAKSAADMVLADDNFASIEKAVEEGRGIYSNVKKAIFYLLSSNFGEVLVMFFTLMLGLPTPLETLQILWINLITDSLPAIALSMNRKEEGIMDQKPRNPKDGIFAHGGFYFTFGYGIVIFLITFIAYLIPGILAFNHSTASFAPQVMEEFGNGYSGFVNCLENEIVHRECTTWAFTTLALSQIFHMLGMTDIKHSFIHVFRDGNVMLLVSFVLGFALQAFVTEVPGVTSVFSTSSLHILEWLILIGLSIVPLLIHEILAPIFRKKKAMII